METTLAETLSGEPAAPAQRVVPGGPAAFGDRPAEGPAVKKQPGTFFTLKLGLDGRLLLGRGGGEQIAVSVKRCFPWSQPLSWFSLRDDDAKEVELVESFAELDSDSREELVKALAEASFVFTIERILSIDEEFELRSWRVLTRQGERLFQTRMNAWPRELAGRSLLVQDVANDLYVVPDLDALDAHSQKKLWAFMDDD